MIIQQDLKDRRQSVRGGKLMNHKALRLHSIQKVIMSGTSSHTRCLLQMRVNRDFVNSKHQGRNSWRQHKMPNHKEDDLVIGKI